MSLWTRLGRASGHVTLRRRFWGCANPLRTTPALRVVHQRMFHRLPLFQTTMMMMIMMVVARLTNVTNTDMAHTVVAQHVTLVLTTAQAPQCKRCSEPKPVLVGQARAPVVLHM